MNKDTNEPFDMDSPEAWEQGFIKQFCDLYKRLETKHARRRRSPLIFINTYRETAEVVRRSFCTSGWESVDREAERLKRLVERLESDYKECLEPAARQRERNATWDLIYNPPPRLLEGGRADGNGSR